MVNLLVFALLLTSCFADQIKIHKFRFMCKRRDGTYANLDRLHVVIRAFKNGFLSRDQDIGRLDANADTGVMNMDKAITFDNGREVQINVDLRCDFPYRKECPSINNLCNARGHSEGSGSHMKWYTLAIPYTEADANWRSMINTQGYWAIITPHTDVMVPNYFDLPSAPMTNAQICEHPEGPRVIDSCNSSESSRRDKDSNREELLIENFSFSCKKKDGNFAPLDATNILFRVIDNGWILNEAYDLGSAITNSEGGLTIDQGSLKFNSDRKVEVLIDLKCDAPYRSQCPAVNNMCGSKQDSNLTPQHYTIRIPYNVNADKFRGGALALITPSNVQLVHSKADLPTAPMTKDQFCEFPHGSTVKPCSWPDEESNVVGSRPARLANKGLF